jgi:hypothetical protein
MKSSFLRSLVVTLGLSAAFGPVSLMAQGEIRATIPFDFTVGAKSFPAGEYSFQRVKDNIFTVYSVHGHAGVLAGAMPAEEASRSGMAVVTFRRYGENYFLSAVCDGSRSWELFQSTTEKQLIAKRKSTQPVSVAVALPAK